VLRCQYQEPHHARNGRLPHSPASHRRKILLRTLILQEALTASIFLKSEQVIMRLFTKDKAMYRMFFTIMLISGLQDLVAYGVNLADNLMLGNYSEPALAAVAQCTHIQFLLIMLSAGCGEGVVIFSSQYWGKKNTEAIRKISAIGVRVAIYLSLILFILCFFFTRQVLSFLAGDDTVVATGIIYLKIVSFSYVIFAIRSVLLTTLRSVETVSIGLYLSIVTLVINICLNYVMIFGKCNFPELGVAGAAIATLIARIMEFAILMFYVKRIDRKIKMQVIKDCLHLDAVLTKDYIRYATPLIASLGLWGIALFLQAAILGHLGQTVITASAISNTFFSVVSVFGFGMTRSASVVAGKTIGEGRFEEVKQYAVTLQIIFCIVALISGAILYATFGFILGFYNITPESWELTKLFLQVLTITIIGSLYQNPVLGGIIRGSGNTRFAFIVDNSFMFLFTLPASFFSAYILGWPPVVTFALLKADQVLKCFVAVVVVNRFRWIKILTRDTSGELPENPETRQN
jgi:putative MATE family efflux protein